MLKSQVIYLRDILNLWLPSSSHPHLNIRFVPHIKQTVLSHKCQSASGL
jgi:hypothetical protein